MTSPPVRLDEALGGWVVAGNAEARRVLRDASAFSTVAYAGAGRDLGGAARVLTADGADHRRLRGALAGAFTPAWVRRVERTLLQPTAARLARQLRAAEIDVVAAYVKPYARSSLYAYVGVAPDAGDEIVAALRVAHGHFDRASEAAPAGHAAAQVARSLALAALAGPGRDAWTLRSRLHASGVLTDDEQLVCLLPLFETLAVKVERDLPATLVRALAALPPDRQLRLLATPRARRAAVHEALRLQRGGVLPRQAIRDVPLGEAMVRAGEHVFVLVDEAGRDPAIFSRPAAFDPERSALSRHPGFGLGQHACVGRQLAIALAATAAGALVERFALAASGEEDTVVRLTPRAGARERDDRPS